MNIQLHNKLKFIAIAQQGLGNKRFSGKDAQSVNNLIEHLGYLQIDTLSVVRRTQDHVLWSRIPHGKPNSLNELVAQKQIFEHWFHAASYLPMRDWRFALPRMQSVRDNKHPYLNNADTKVMSDIMHRIKTEGPLSMRDFKEGKASDAKFWKVGATRKAFDRLFMQGDLMISERKGMQKTYDLAENCLPDNIDARMPSTEDLAQYLFDTTLRSHGVFTLKQIIHLRAGKTLKEKVNNIILRKLNNGSLTKIHDLADTYVSTELVDSRVRKPSHVHILSPFDNVLIHRDRLETLFNYPYRLECYVPAKKRVFGYFCLPILYAGEFVGRMDCKAHRDEHRFEVISLHIEKEIKDRDKFLFALEEKLQAFIAFNGCDNSIRVAALSKLAGWK